MGICCDSQERKADGPDGTIRQSAIIRVFAHQYALEFYKKEVKINDDCFIVSHPTTGLKYFVHTIPTNSIDFELMLKVMNLEHPCILRIKEVYNHMGQLGIVQDYLPVPKNFNKIHFAY